MKAQIRKIMVTVEETHREAGRGIVPPTRKAVAPKFPFDLISYEKPPHFLQRFEAKRKPAAASWMPLKTAT